MSSRTDALTPVEREFVAHSDLYQAAAATLGPDHPTTVLLARRLLFVGSVLRFDRDVRVPA